MPVTGYACRKPNTPLEPLSYEPAPLAPGDALVRVAGCGLCHTDLAFMHGEVRPRAGYPLILGHEISGTVEDTGEDCRELAGRNVIVPAVMPCGECERCRCGYENTCKRQLMPGNDAHGGFASHVVAPAKYLTTLPGGLGPHDLAELSVIADAVSTPYQTVLRSGLGKDQIAIVIGTGGIGTYGVQIAQAFGARVLAIDIDGAKLDRIASYGAAWGYNSRDKAPREARADVRVLLERHGAPDFGWKIFEMSGTAAGQELAFSLMPPGGTLAVVGFTTASVNLRLSNLMALDATCFGNWGCAPRHYEAVVRLVLDGHVTLKPFVQTAPLKDINRVIAAVEDGSFPRRAVLMPAC